jgi:hypothetical protein
LTDFWRHPVVPRLKAGPDGCLGFFNEVPARDAVASLSHRRAHRLLKLGHRVRASTIRRVLRALMIPPAPLGQTDASWPILGGLISEYERAA